MKRDDSWWRDYADFVCFMLDQIYVKDRNQYQREAAARGITLEQMTAAAITQMLREKIGT